METATPKQKQDALKAIDNFANDSSTQSAWSNISKPDFVKELKNIINNPASIDQSHTNLCGVAASCKIGAENNPEKFVNLSLGLYQYGEYGKIKANKDLLNSTPSNGLNEATYIIMTSFRNSLNMPFNNYDPKSDNGPSGFTWPNDVNKMINETFGLTRTTEANWTRNTSLKDGIIKSVKSGDFVILLVNTDHFMGLSNWSVNPDHYIQVKNITKNIDGTLNVDWWSWGNKQPTIKMSEEQLKKSTYDYGSFK